jgi:hypothetical protein
VVNRSLRAITRGRPDRLPRAGVASLAISVLQALAFLVVLDATAQDESGSASMTTEPPAAQGAAGFAGVSDSDHRPGRARASELAADGLVDIQTVVGFSDTFRLGRWTPLTVVVANRGNDLVGQLEVQVTGGDQLQGSVSTTSHRRSLELPRDARKRFRFTVFPESFSRPLLVRVSAGGREVARRVIDLRHRLTRAQLVLVLSRDADLDYLNQPTGETLRVLYPHPELLPDRWQGYDGVEAVVVHGVSLERLSARQHEALKKWVARGGTLAVSGGPDYSLLRTPRLAELLPGTPSGMVRLSDGAAVGQALGSTLDAPRPFEVNRVTRFRGRALHRAGNIPLVIEETRGGGRVLYLTFDVARYPFDGWPGMREFWLRGLGLTPMESRAVDPTEAQDESPVPALVIESRTGFPGHGVVLVFLALYLGILATGYRLGPAGQLGRWLVPWLTWASPLIFAPAAYFLFGPLLFPRGATAFTVSVIAPHPHGRYADLRLDVGMYSNRTQTLRLDYQGAEPTLRPVRRPEKGETIRWVLGEGATTSAEPEGRGSYVLHLLEGEDVIAYEVQGAVEQTQRGLRLRVRNHAGRPLGDALLLLDGRVYPLGPIPEDAQFERVLDADSDAYELEHVRWQTILGRTRGSSARDLHAERVVLEREIGRLDETPRLGPDEARLIGFSTSPLRLVGASSDWQRRDLTLVLVRLPVTRLASNPEASADESM